MFEHAKSKALKCRDNVGGAGAGLWLAAGLAVLLFAGCSQERRMRNHLERGQSAFQAQQYEKAEIEFMNVLRMDPTNRLAMQRLGTIYQQQGDVRKAFGILGIAIFQDTNNLDLHLRLGLTHLGVRNTKEARAEAVFVLTRQPTNEEALVLYADAAVTPADIEESMAWLGKLRSHADREAGYHLAVGTLHLRQNSPAAAATEFSRALALDPKSGAAHLAMGTLCMASNDVKQAEQYFKQAADLSPLRSTRRLKYAEFKIHTGDLDGARAVLAKVVQGAPDFIPASLRLAELDLLGKKLDDCGAILKRVLARDTMNYDGLLLRSRLHLAQGQVTNAIGVLEQMSREYPWAPQVHYEAGVAQLVKGDLGKAVLSLNQAVTLNPNQSDAVLLLAELNIQKGELAAATTALNGLIKRQPQLLQAYLSLGKAYEIQRNLEAALAVYRRLAEASPNNPRPHYHIGLLLRERKDLAGARKSFDRGLELAPDDLVLLEQLVDLDVAEKRFDSALQRTEKIIAKYPKIAAPRLIQAEVQLAQGRTNEAEATLAKTIELQPDSSEAYMRLARIHVSSGRQAQALEKLRIAGTKDPKAFSVFLMMGLLHEQSRDYKAARDAYEKAVAANPACGPALNNLANLYSDQFGQLDKAYELVNKARDVFLSNPAGTDTYAWIICQRGEYARALGLLRQCAEKVPGQPDILYHLGMVHYMTGEEAAARLAFQQALQTKLAFQGRADAEQRLAFLNTDVATASPETVARLEERLAAQPADTLAAGRLASIYERTGAFDKAKQAYEKALTANPRAVTMVIKLAQLYRDRFGNNPKALELAKTARELAPEDPKISHLVGQLAFRAGDHKWALILLQGSLQKLPQDADVLFDLAFALYSNGRIPDAEAAMNKALAANPNLPRAGEARRFLALSTLYVNPAKARQELALIQETLKTEPDSLPALMAVGVLHEQGGKVAEARQTYERIVAISPQFSPGVRQLAMIYGQDPKEDKRAYELGTRAREAYGQDADLSKMLGLVSHRSSDYTRAVQLLKESARTRTNDAEVFYYLGMSHHQLKAKKEATDALNRALALNLKAPLAEEAKRVLAPPK